MKVLLLALMLAGCASTKDPEFIVMKFTWKYCWEACGKKDNLAAVSMHECICSQGDPIPINPLVRNQRTANSGFMDDFLKFLNGE